MTFPEAGIQVLEKAGRPLLVQEIVAKAVEEGLLSHVGQIPEQTMRERLSALARRSTDRKLVVVGPGQFALSDWGLPEDSEALAALEGPEDHPDEKPLRGKERHPPLSKAGARSDGGREQREGRNKKKKRLPPLSAVVADMLGEVGSTADIETLLERGRDKGLMSDELSRETVLNALSEENRRRTKNGQSAMFQIDAGEVKLLATGEGGETPTPVEEAGDRPRTDTAPSGQAQTLESRRQAARNMRRRVLELSSAQVERLALLLLGRSGYRDPRPVRLSGGENERLFVLRRKLGLTEFRFLCQVLPAGREVSRESLQLLRAWLPEADAHAALVIGPGDATREARTESQRVGLPLLTLLCGDAFLEELVQRQVGVLTYEAVAIDDVFWRNFRRSPEPRPRSEGSSGSSRADKPERTRTPAPEVTASAPTEAGTGPDAGVSEIDLFLAGTEKAPAASQPEPGTVAAPNDSAEATHGSSSDSQSETVAPVVTPE